ncbi:hypothetical protein GQ53DRAFT_753782 [Thozetella sp. PMI_491]|nr:hypothetical protein GQ53DRAFT_753782 [Thozetella sp. PMI_491]
MLPKGLGLHPWPQPASLSSPTPVPNTIAGGTSIRVGGLVLWFVGSLVRSVARTVTHCCTDRPATRAKTTAVGELQLQVTVHT